MSHIIQIISFYPPPQFILFYFIHFILQILVFYGGGEGERGRKRKRKSGGSSLPAEQRAQCRAPS